MRSSLPVAIALLSLAAAPARAQSIRGRVLDGATGQPVAEATVTALDSVGRRAGRARSSADGSFALELRRAGNHRLSAERIGYRTATSGLVDVGVRETVEVELRIVTSELALEPLTVRGRAEPPRRPRLESTGFYDREREGFGHFVRREDIEKVPTQRMTDLLRRVPGVQLRAMQNGKYEIVMRGGGMTSTSGTCEPKVIVDGVAVSQGRRSASGSFRGGGGTVELDLNDVVKPEAVEAVEIYRSPAETPMMYGGANSMCGVIVIWTRTGM
ncbi:MAG TPA: carboxypeptidase regulatory-like domain-containing protein [Longimicrobium sp.]|nr:carboxypeptidase regulatory-like domain-containing protein [Longimicrobium sp.]